MKRRSSMLLVTIVLMANGPVSTPSKPTAKHDSNAPVDFSADHMEVRDLEHRAFMTGAVRAVQEDMTITADRMASNYTGSFVSSTAQIHRLDANGHVVVTRPTETARGNFGIYDVDKRLVTLIGNVTLDRSGPNASIVRGSRLVIDLNTNQASMDGEGSDSSDTNGAGGRVSARFSVPQKTDTDAAAKIPNKITKD